MKDNTSNDIYYTNMDKDDPLIEKFMKQYMKEKAKSGNMEKDDLIVNFDITYADGTSETYTCGSESKVFGKGCKEEKCIFEKPKKKEVKEKKCCNDFEDEKCCNKSKEENYCDEVKEENYYNDFSYKEDDFDFEEGKWSNCSEEWSESSKGIKKHKCKDEQEVQNKCVHTGKITVYSILSCDESSTLKGVKINLYKLNGITPEFKASKETDYEGKAVFDSIEEGSYRVIEIIDKRYFEKPVYLNWNEFTINSENDNCTLYVLNSLRQYRKY